MSGRRGLTKGEIKRVLAAFAALGGTYELRNVAMFVTGLVTGFRISELLSLTISSVWQNGGIVDEVTVARSDMKGKHRGRTIVLNTKAKLALAAWLPGLRHMGGVLSTCAVFASRQSFPSSMTVRNAYGIYMKAFNAAGLTGSLGTHSTRKTFGQAAFIAFGGNLIDTQEAMGHADPKSTSLYVQPRHDTIRRVILDM